MREGVALCVVLAQDEVHAAARELRVRLFEAYEFAAPEKVAFLHASVVHSSTPSQFNLMNTRAHSVALQRASSVRLHDETKREQR